MPKMVRIMVNLPPQMLERIDKTQEEEGISRSEIIRRAIRDAIVESNAEPSVEEVVSAE